MKDAIDTVSPSPPTNTAAESSTAPDLTIIILSYNVRELLKLAIRTALEACRHISGELIVVDNASGDSSAEMVRETFPEVRLIALSKNNGFSNGNNAGIEVAQGRYIVLLNPDTVVHPDALKTLIDHLDTHPEAGAAGPRIVKPDGSVDMAGRRGFPSPSAAFYKMVGLSYVFPKSKRFGGYNLTWQEPDVAGEVDAISGCCFCIRREVIDRVGVLDDDYFMYGEDLDWCYRIRQGGWTIQYVPQAEIVHFGGQSSRSMPRWKQLYEFHRAMRLFVKKHLSEHHGFVALRMIEIAIALRAVGTMVWRTAVAMAPTALDLILVMVGLAGGIWLRTLAGWTVPPFRDWEWVGLASIWFAGWVLGSLVSGLWKERSSLGRAALTAGIGLAVAIIGQYLTRGLNFSRIATLSAWILTAVTTVGWRWIVTAMGGSERTGATPKRALLIGSGKRAKMFLSVLSSLNCHYDIAAVLTAPDDENEGRAVGEQVGGHRVVGTSGDLIAISRSVRVDDIIVALDRFEYSSLLAAGGASRSGVGRFRVVPDDFLLAVEPLKEDGGPVHPDQLPLIDIESVNKRWWQR